MTEVGYCTVFNNNSDLYYRWHCYGSYSNQEDVTFQDDKEVPTQ